MYGFKNIVESEKSEEAVKDLFNFITDRKSQEVIMNYINSKDKDTNYVNYRRILKNMFPGSGLLQMKNKNTGEIRQIGTYTGPASEEGINEFNHYRVIAQLLASAKGLKPLHSITVSSELGKAFNANTTRNI